MEANALAGTWRLVSWENHGSDGSVTYPMGQDAQGYVVYNPDGYMAVVIARANRPVFQSPDLSTVTPQEWVVVATTFMSYCGRYEVQEGRVLHYVEASLLPNWVGTTQERILKLEGTTLTLSTPPMLSGGQERTAHLIWQRVEPA